MPSSIKAATFDDKVSEDVRIAGEGVQTDLIDAFIQKKPDVNKGSILIKGYFREETTDPRPPLSPPSNRDGGDYFNRDLHIDATRANIKEWKTWQIANEELSETPILEYATSTSQRTVAIKAAYNKDRYSNRQSNA